MNSDGVLYFQLQLFTNADCYYEKQLACQWVDIL